MSLTLLFAGTGVAGDGSGATLVSIAVSPSPGVMYMV